MNSNGRNPKCPLSTTHVLLFVQLSTKYKIRMSNLCAQHNTVAELKHRDIVTCMCVNAIRTILQLTLVTHGHLLRVRLGATNGTFIPIVTHNILIIIVLLCRCGPNMCVYMFPWNIWRVPYLSWNQKMLQMQEYMHVLMQLCTGSPPYVPYNAPMPHACKQVLNLCPIETMHIVVFLLALRQSLSTDKGPYHMEAPLVCTIHGANLIIHIMSLYPFGPLAIPYENIRRCPRGQRTNPNNVAKTINGNRYFIYTTGIFWIEEDITKDASYTSDGHAVHIMCDKIRKVWDMVPLKQSFHPSNFGDSTIQVRMKTMHTAPPSILGAPLCSGEEMSTPIRRSVLQEEKEAEQTLVWKYVLAPILQPKLLGRVGIKTHIKGDEIRIGCFTPTFSGAQKRAEMLHHPCILGGPQTRGHNQKSKRTLGATMMPLVSQSMGL